MQTMQTRLTKQILDCLCYNTGVPPKYNQFMKGCFYFLLLGKDDLKWSENGPMFGYGDTFF